MFFKSFILPCMTDLETWVLDYDVHNVLFRMWRKGADEDCQCDYIYIRHIITLPNGEIMLGVVTHDENSENNMYPYIDYYMMSEVTLAVSEMDTNPEKYD